MGVGISGREGRQAVLASDYAIPSFRHLKRLLLVHGNRSYYRMSALIQFSVCKNLCMALPQFWFSFWSLFTGQLMYFDLLFTMFNALFTTLPVIALATNDEAGATDHTLERRRAGHYLYRLGNEDTRFTPATFAGWVLGGIWQSGVVFAVAFLALDPQLVSSCGCYVLLCRDADCSCLLCPVCVLFVMCSRAVMWAVCGCKAQPPTRT